MATTTPDRGAWEEPKDRTAELEGVGQAELCYHDDY
jgi:hypothetical protein